MNMQKLKIWFKKCLVIGSIISLPALAQTTTFEVNVAALPATTTTVGVPLTPFTRIDFLAPFAAGIVPNVFPMTPEFGAGAADDPCTIRIRNIDNTGFDAACLEPRNEDRDTPAVNFNYVAMINGTLNVPIVGSANTVRFESQCSTVSTQVFGPRCNNCTISGSQGYTLQNFLSPAFTNPPALLTQLSSTNNNLTGVAGLPDGQEPEFLEAAVRNNTLSTTGFQWTLDRMEAGNGSISSSEQLCYLAVERNGCQELDFSSFNGPASVDFTALFGDNVDGHGNGASSGEGATFPVGCFSSTPITLAGGRSRRGNNGGFLRLVSENTTEAIFTFDEDRVSDTERNHIDEEISAIAFSSIFSTPVTLSRSKVTQFGRKTRFEWETSSETFHLGFHLWGETDSGWEQLNRKLIPGSELDTAQANTYQRTIRLNRQQLNTIRRFGISTVDNTGFEEFYGPFELNTEYGESANNEPVNWASTRAVFEQNMQGRGFTKVNQRWRRVSTKKKQRILAKKLGANASVLNLEFETSGIHAVSAQQIFDILPNWEGVPLAELALTLNGKAAPRDVLSNDNLFSLDDYILINVRTLDGHDAIYLKNYTYQLRLDRRRAQKASYFDGALVDENNISTTGMVSVTATHNKVYSAGIEANEPWYDRRLLSRGSPASAHYTIDFPHPIDSEKSAFVDVTVFGGVDLRGDVDDHHIQILVNGTVLDDATFDGLTRYNERLEVPAGLLTQTNNIVTVNVVGDTGLAADLILVGDITLSASEILDNRTSYNFFTTQANANYNPNSAIEVLGSVK